MGARGLRSPPPVPATRTDRARAALRPRHRAVRAIGSTVLGIDRRRRPPQRARRRPAGRCQQEQREGGGYASLDVRAAKDVTFAKGTPRARTLTISIDAFNVVNQVNYTGYVGTIGSPLFGQPIVARPPRQLQVSTHLKF